MDVSALQSLNIDVLVALLVTFASFSFILLSIVIKFINKIGKLEETIGGLLENKVQTQEKENNDENLKTKESVKKEKKDPFEVLDSLNKLGY